MLNILLKCVCMGVCNITKLQKLLLLQFTSKILVFITLGARDLKSTYLRYRLMADSLVTFCDKRIFKRQVKTGGNHTDSFLCLLRPL